MKVSDSKFLKAYRNQAKEVIKKKHPEISDDDIKKIIDAAILKNLINPPSKLENTYTHEERDSTLLSVLDWCIDTKPIIAANGTFFKQHKDAINPNALMLEEFLTLRKKIKKEMFALEDESSRLYKMKDLDQGNQKKLANSYYGGSGMKASAFYNKFTAPSTTKSAQSVISTCMTTFEAFLANSFTFVDINECYYWMSIVLKEDVTVEDWVERKDIEATYARLSKVIIGASDDDKNSLYEYLKTLSVDELTRLYWKNNFIEFTDTHQYVKDLHHLVLEGIRNFDPMRNENDFSVVPDEYLDKVKSAKKPMKAWNDIVNYEKFYDPNKPPETVKPILKALSDTYMKYVYVKYMYTDRIYKLKNFNRWVVTVIDTDSNILSLDTWMNYYLENIKDGNYGRSDWDNIFIAINTSAYVITNVITATLLYYGEMSNVAEEFRPKYSMKNEFFFSNLILAKVKKRYLSKVILREGNRLTKPKYDVKGYDFKKASTSDSASKFFMHVVQDMLLEPDNVDIKALMMELQRFRKEVHDSLEAGERIYLPTGNAKEIEAYASPESEQSVRGAFAWNVLYPDKSVELPVKLSILKTNIYELSDVDELRIKDPAMYEKIENGIFKDTTGFFVKRSKDGKLKTEGLSVIGIPLNEKIPDWIIPHIDYSTVVNSVLAPFKSVTETFNIPSIEEGRTGRKTTGFTNIIRL